MHIYTIPYTYVFLHPNFSLQTTVETAGTYPVALFLAH